MLLMYPPTLHPARVNPGGYQNLRVWQAAVDLATQCYLMTAAFPAWERFGLSAQMRSAAVSVVSNIAEGHGRGTKRAFANFLSIANGSLKELESQIILAQRMNFINDHDGMRLLDLCSVTGGMLHGLRRSLRSSVPAADGRRHTAGAVAGTAADTVTE